MFFRVATLALALLCFPTVSVSAQVNIPYSNCGSSDHITISSAQSNVWPPVAGQSLDLILSGVSDEEITGGTYEAKVTFDWIPILDKTGSLSDLGVGLPLPKGPATIKKSVNLPSSIPSGSISIHVTANDQNGQELVCVDISASMGDKFPSVIIHNFGFESAADVSVPFTNCGSSTDLLNITSLTASAWPPVAGSALTLTGSGTASADVTAGSFEATVSYMGIQLIDKKGNLASVVPLPQRSGPATMSKTVSLPSALPPGPYAIQATGTDQNGRSLGCVNIAFIL